MSKRVRGLGENWASILGDPPPAREARMSIWQEIKEVLFICKDLASVIIGKKYSSLRYL